MLINQGAERLEIRSKGLFSGKKTLLLVKGTLDELLSDVLEINPLFLGETAPELGVEVAFQSIRLNSEVSLETGLGKGVQDECLIS